MTNLNIVILAAGKGIRMYSAKPKVLHELAGKAMLQHLLDTAKKINACKTIVVYGHGGESVPNAVTKSNTKFVLQEPQLGTGHAVQQALPLLGTDGTTLVLYGDVPLIQADTLLRLLEVENSLNLLTQYLDEPKGYGRIVRDLTSKIISIVEEKDATPQQREINEINTGILSAPTAMLRNWLSKLQNNNSQGEYYLTDIVAMAVAQKVEIRSTQPDHPWEVMGVNSKVQLAELERLWQREQANKLLSKGVTVIDPARIDIRGNLECEQDVEIDVGCIFEGAVKLARGVKVGAYCVLKNSTIAADTQIAPYSHIDGGEIGEACHIGPYARIRPGSKLHNEVHIGNFVEIKNSEISNKSKANHLSYIGDATVGARVNIGAGTITCNYDGANKFRTIIEDDAFIGSDTQLIAPVTVGRGATIGAGSTITKDTPAEELTLSRSKQISITGWKRPVKKKIT
ncbi:MAG: bifunctional UDP-N-acetylglucosamine diphosphorylase/glucosamine-1-phosphate N-acetyltransferase GlmU [Gallionellaceae bacterium]|nr:bifunctional UDP-N-acetylglucosamine diphosphorylase/glucosamine-1-phosphate N-acetyltransferase GlmU [Gallionellaceae bacterium]